MAQFSIWKENNGRIAVAEAIDESVVPVIQEIPVIHGIPVVPAVVEQKTERSKPITSRQPPPTFKARVSITDPILEVPSIGYFGFCTRSPSKRWVAYRSEFAIRRTSLHEPKPLSGRLVQRPSPQIFHPVAKVFLHSVRCYF